MRPRQGLLGILLGAAVVIANAQEADKLTSGPGSSLTENKCKICHELQHIRRTPLSRGPSFREIAQRYAGDAGGMGAGAKVRQAQWWYR